MRLTNQRGTKKHKRPTAISLLVRSIRIAKKIADGISKNNFINNIIHYKSRWEVKNGKLVY